MRENLLKYEMELGVEGRKSNVETNPHLSQVLLFRSFPGYENQPPTHFPR